MSLSVAEATAVVALAAFVGCLPTRTVKAQTDVGLQAAERELSGRE